MDINGLKPLFGERSLVVTVNSKDFIGVLQPINGSQSAVSMTPIDAQTANYYAFAINGVAALDVGSIHFAQKLVPAP